MNRCDRVAGNTNLRRCHVALVLVEVKEAARLTRKRGGGGDEAILTADVLQRNNFCAD